jgi:CHASE2 domain-containing sensor protein
MIGSPVLYQLNVQQFGQVCVFELSWGEGQRLQATLAFPDSLMGLYRQWQKAYLEYYQRVHIPLETTPEPGASLRGKAAGSGTVLPPAVDWGKHLSDAENEFLREFRLWLRHSSDLDELRREIAIASRSSESEQGGVELLITCTPLDLARLPWETWDIAADFAIASKIRISRAPINIRAQTAVPHRQSRRPRILVILGDDRGLDFAADVKALQRSLSPMAELVFQGWRPGQRVDDLKRQISEAIADEQGWDVLIFAGHSNESTSGDLGIAPGVAISVCDIAPQLVTARERGLQFAVFNSCKGLNIAGSLIDLGLNQVVVMREPIENRVAQEFLVRFLQSLADHKDVHESLISACQYLATDKKLTYPSAYLIPSLFRHPNSHLFSLPHKGWQHRLKPWLSKPYQVAALVALVLLSLLPSVQHELLDQRVLWQARYRQMTQRDTTKPSLLLVRVDEESLKRADLIGKEHPIPQGYLADLVDRLVAQRARTIAMDYVLDSRQSDGTPRLADSIKRAGMGGTQFVLATTWDNDGKWHPPLSDLAQPVYTFQANAERSWFDDYHIPLLTDEQQPYPLFAALVAQLHHRQVKLPAGAQISLRQRLQPLTQFSYGLGQRWLHPITDFSLRPNQVYESRSGWTILQNPEGLTNLEDQTVMIVPGGYASAGWKPGDDNFAAPAAMQYWYLQEQTGNTSREMTGGEHQAYLFDHFLNQRFVVPIPDGWMVLVAALLGKSIMLLLQRQSGLIVRHRSIYRVFGILLLVGGTALYGLLSLELYLSPAAILLPILLPVIMVWVYLLPPILNPQR